MATDKEKSQSQLIAELEQARERIVRLKSRTSGEGMHGDSAAGSVLDLSPGDHLCCVYRNEEEHRAVLAPFVRSGLEQGHKVVYIADDRTAETVMGFLRQEGIPLEHATASGQLLVASSLDTYLKGGKFDPQAMIELLRQETDRALREGYAALRITGEMSWALRGLSGSERLMEYECMLNRFLPNNPAIGLCQYDMRHFEPEVILDVLDTHPIAVVGDRYYENTYYLSPEEYLGQNRAEAELSRRLEHLERKRLDEEALREREASYREIFENAPVGIFQTDSTGTAHRINSEMARILGASSSEEAMERFRNLDRDLYVYPERRDKFLRLLRDCGEVQNFEYEARSLGGGSVWLSMNARISQWLTDGSFLIEGFATDITEHKRTEAALRESESKFRNIFNSSSEAIFIHDSEGRFLEVNDVACERLGYTRRELLRMTPGDIDGPEASRRTPERIRLLDQSGELAFEGTHVRKDGEEVPVEITSRLIQYAGKTCILSTARDIRERKAAEAKRDEYQRILSSAFRAMDSMFMVIDRDYRIVLCNWRDHEWVPEERREQRPYCYRVMKDLQAPCGHCPPAKTFRDGRVRRYEDQNPIDNSLKEIDVLPILDEEGRVEYVLENVRDVTQRKRAEQELERSRYLLDKSQEIAHVGSWELEVATGELTWSDETYRIFGLAPQERPMDYDTFLGFVHPEDRDAVHSAYWESVRNHRDSYEVEHRIHPRGGNGVRTVLEKCSHIRDETGRVVRSLGMIQDITELKRSEDKIRHLNRVLSAIRNVNQLITAEKDRDRLIRGACDRLTETRGYDSAWIVLLDQAGRCSIRAQAGLDESFPAFAEEIAAGRLPVCARQALDGADVVVRDPESLCAGCPLAEASPGSSRVAFPLMHQEMVFGVLAVSLPASRAEDEDELDLVREVAGDIAFALYDIDLEEDRVRAEAALHDSERFLRSTLDGLAAHIAVLDQSGEIVLVNRAWREFAEANGIAEGYVSEGINYITVCSEATGEYTEGARDFAQRIREVISGEREFFSLEYPCPSPDQERWFAGRVTPFFDTPQRRVVVSHWEITDRKLAERALRESERNYRDLFNNSPVGIHLTDSRGTPYYVNPEMARMLGASSPEELLRRFPDFTADLYVRPERREELMRILREHGEAEHFEFEARRLDGERIWMSIYARIREWFGEEDFLIDGFAVDVTERKRAEEALRRLTEEQGLLLESVPTQIWYLTDVDRYGAVNQAHADFYGLSRQAMEYRWLWDFLPREEARICRDGNIQVFETGERIQTEEWLHDATGEQRLIEIIKTPKLNARGEVEYVVCAGTDITERKQMEDKLREMSLYDALTGLYNRSLFEEEIRRLQDERYCPMGIIVCDINGLKLINDTMGHAQGDNLLRTFADLLKRCFRGSDIMARIGGDEFAVLLPQSTPETVRECSWRIRQEVTQHNAQDQNLDLSVSLGFAVEDGPSLDMRGLFKKADDIMYKDKLQQSYSSRSATVQALIKTLEARDFITDGHAGRLHNYAQKLGHSLGLSEERLNDLQILARFHDLGKVGIPDHILFKPGRLTEEEFEEMKRHCEIGHRIAMSTSDLAPVADYILKHHEWWDGRGYPLGIQGEEIPLECRILALVDAYDAMTSERPYKGAMPHEEAVEELQRCAGTQFDPGLVEEFIRILGESEG